MISFLITNPEKKAGIKKPDHVKRKILVLPIIRSDRAIVKRTNQKVFFEFKK